MILIQNRKTQESTERRKTSFPKEIVKNGDLHKPASNKRMTTPKCVKYNAIAPLK